MKALIERVANSLSMPIEEVELYISIYRKVLRRDLRSHVFLGLSLLYRKIAFIKKIEPNYMYSKTLIQTIISNICNEYIVETRKHKMCFNINKEKYNIIDNSVNEFIRRLLLIYTYLDKSKRLKMYFHEKAIKEGYQYIEEQRDLIKQKLYI